MRSKAILLGCAILIASVSSAAGAGSSGSRLTDEVIPYQVQIVPKRPQPLELGSPFLGTGRIERGFQMPGGAWWQPQLLIWGTMRTAIQSYDGRGDERRRVTEWRNRLDIFGELEVSPTERIVVGFRPFDERDPNTFSGCEFEPGSDCDGHFSEYPTTLFAEFNFGEIWPNLDPDESRALDIEVSVGRQPLLFQDGLLINDTIDSLAITRNNIVVGGTTNTRITGIVGIDNIHRGDNVRDDDATLGALLIETDTPLSTINLDIAFVGSDQARGDSIHAGISFIQRLGHFNTLFRGLYSNNLDGRSAAATDGALLMTEISWIPTGTHDNLYVNAFAAIDEFSSAARAQLTGGPLGRTGVLFAAVGLGNYTPALTNRVRDAAGMAVGYQKFFNNGRQWLLAEVGGMDSWSGDGTEGGVAGGLSYRHAIGQRYAARADTFVNHTDGGDFGWGARIEWLVQF